LNNYTTTGGAKNPPVIAGTGSRREVHGTANDFTNLFLHVDAKRDEPGLVVPAKT
jgi:hypothetical protein